MSRRARDTDEEFLYVAKTISKRPARNSGETSALAQPSWHHRCGSAAVLSRLFLTRSTSSTYLMYLTPDTSRRSSDTDDRQPFKTAFFEVVVVLSRRQPRWLTPFWRTSKSL